MMRSCLYILIVILTFSCTKNDGQQIVEDNVVSPQMQRVEISEVFHPDQIGLSDSSVVVINRKSSPFFFVYDRDNYSSVGAFGVQGNGPEDYIFPMFLQQPEAPKGDLTVYDVNVASFREINLSRLFSKQGQAIASSPMSPLLIGSSTLIKHDSVYYGTIDNGEGLFFVYNPSKDERNWIPFPASLLQSENGFTVMNANRISANRKAGRIVSAPMYYNRLFVLDMRTGSLLKEVYVGEEPVSPRVMEQTISEDSKLFCTDIHSTEDCIYVLMQTVKSTEWEGVEGTTSRILVLDWDLNYLRTYQLPHFITKFMIDPRSHRILYTALDKDENAYWYYWTE